MKPKLKMIIYKVRNKINGKCYIGQTVRSLDERMYWHIYSARTGPTSFIHRALRKYGIQSFECSVIDVADSKESLTEKEIYWIQILNTKIPNGYNMTDGGIGGANNKGKPHSKETIRKMSELKKGNSNPFFGKHHSEKIKEKMSMARKGNQYGLGHKHTEEFKKQRAEAWRGDKNPMRKKELSN